MTGTPDAGLQKKEVFKIMCYAHLIYTEIPPPPLQGFEGKNCFIKKSLKLKIVSS